MTSVLLSASVSLDGFLAGPDVGMDLPMGRGGERLHEWIFATDGDRGVDPEIARGLGSAGAVVIGRRTFEIGLPHWGGTPFPVPCFVVTHEGRPDLPTDTGTFAFVSGIERAIERARDAAGERHVLVMGGADVQQQALRAGLVDEIQLQIIPILLGDGVRMLDRLGVEPARPIELERVALDGSPGVIHCRFRVRRD